MLTCAVAVANNATGPSSPIFLATDSKLVKDLASHMYGSRFKTLDRFGLSGIHYEPKEMLNSLERLGIVLFPGSFPLPSHGYNNEPGYAARFGMVLGIKPLDHMLAAYRLKSMLVAVNHLSTTK